MAVVQPHRRSKRDRPARIGRIGWSHKVVTSRALPRGLLFAITAVSMVWAVTVVRLTANTSVLSQMAAWIWSGEIYGREGLERVLDAYQREEVGCLVPEAADAAATVAYALAERTIASGDASRAREDLRRAEVQARASLACSPHRAHTWFLLFWARAMREGYSPEALQFLSMSYMLAPREEWLATFRHPVAMRFVERFPPEEQQQVVLEFSSLLKEGYFATAAAALGQAGGEIRPRLMAEIAAIPAWKRTVLARRLDELGVEIEIAGVPSRERQTWERYVSSVNKVRELLRRLDSQVELDGLQNRP